MQDICWPTIKDKSECTFLLFRHGEVSHFCSSFSSKSDQAQAEQPSDQSEHLFWVSEDVVNESPNKLCWVHGREHFIRSQRVLHWAIGNFERFSWRK